MLVFAANLQEVEEVGCRGVNGYCVLFWGRNGVWESGDSEVFRSLCCLLESSAGERDVLLPLRIL